MRREEMILYALHFNHDYEQMAYALKFRPEVTPLPMVDAITYIDEDYPKSLFDLPNPPFVLFYLGNKELLTLPAISIIGSRKPSEYAIGTTVELVRNLKHRYVIVSGLAKGIDGVAHREALDDGYTIGILGCGIHEVYPKINEPLYKEMSTNHLILSEYPLHQPPLKHQFPFRNRLIAALSAKCVVTSAAKLSGTMHTVNAALALGKEVITIPYQMNDYFGEGCNQLILQGACVLTNVEDFAMI